MQTRLEATEALEGVEGHEEGDADEDDILEDATFLGSHVHHFVDGYVTVGQGPSRTIGRHGDEVITVKAVTEITSTTSRRSYNTT